MNAESNVNPRIVITGGHGFVGRPLTRQLVAAGYDVTVIDDLSKGAPDPVVTGEGRAATLVTGSILDQEFVWGVMAEVEPTVVVHLAAMHFIPDCDREPDRCIRVNVAGTQNLLRSAVALPAVPIFILASTAAVYAPSLAAHTEDDLLEPMDIYGLTKLWCEHLVRLFHAQYAIPAIVARLFNVYGPGETSPHLIPSLITQAKRSPQRILVGDLSTRRDYVYVDDVARAIVAMVLNHGARRGLLTCNIGSGLDRSGQDVLESLASIVKTDLHILPDDLRIRMVDRPRLTANVRLAHELFDWEPTTSFAEGLATAVTCPYAIDTHQAAQCDKSASS